jgi:circadian clock protein KaiC
MATLLARSAAMGLDLQSYLVSRQLHLQQIDPGELSPGAFSSLIRAAVETRESTILVIDSLNAYMQSMPGEQFLTLQLHEVLSYLGQQGVKSIFVLGQHGIVGEVGSDIDLNYLSDTIMLFRFFEALGTIRSAISVVKSRSSAHERTIHELQLSAEGLQVGEPLIDFEGVMGGAPSYRGNGEMLPSPPANAA